jgi:hypothetical protein
MGHVVEVDVDAGDGNSQYYSFEAVLYCFLSQLEDGSSQ